jgi:hypothetical protein
MRLEQARRGPRAVGNPRATRMDVRPGPGHRVLQRPDRSLDAVFGMLQRLGIPAEGRDEEVVGSSSRIGGEVLERVLRRAEGLGREWAWME